MIKWQKGALTGVLRRDMVKINNDMCEEGEIWFTFMKPNNRIRKCRECKKLAIWMGKYQGKNLFLCDTHFNKFKKKFFKG